MFLRTNMSIVKLEIKIPEVVKAVEAFAANRRKAFDLITQEVQQTISTALNQILGAEIDIFLGSPDQQDNKRNGYQPEREYAIKGIGSVRIRTPKDRLGKFESKVIPSHERVDPRLKADMAILHLAGLSTRTLSLVSKKLLGVEVSKSSVSNSLDLVKEEASKWLTRPIEQPYWALYIDGTNFKIQRPGSTEREPSLVVLGIGRDNHKSVLAIEPGHRDNVESWRSVFRELKKRGLVANQVRIGIMDGLPGLEKLFKEEFPNAVTARCWVHSLRNALAKTPARYHEAFKLMAHKVMYAASESDARSAFRDLKASMGNQAERAIYCLEKDLESLLTHYSFEKKYWPSLKTTNGIERINKELKRRTKSMETIGEASLRAVVAFTALRLEYGWRRHTVDSKALDNLQHLKAKNTENLLEKSIEEIGLVH